VFAEIVAQVPAFAGLDHAGVGLHGAELKP